jgi:dihydrofolate reductase
MIKLIIAVDEGNAIGWKDGRLPWKIPADLKRFKELTLHSTVLMGRKTFESLNRPKGLPERNNLVMSRTLPHTCFPNEKVNVLKAPLEHVIQAHQATLGGEPEDLWIIGGAQVYAEAIEKQLVDGLYLTLVHIDSGADVILPFELAAWKLFMLQQEKAGVQWNLTSIEPVHETEGPAYTFITLQKQAYPRYA